MLFLLYVECLIVVRPDKHFQNKYLIFRNPTENPLKPWKISSEFINQISFLKRLGYIYLRFMLCNICLYRDIGCG